MQLKDKTKNSGSIQLHLFQLYSQFGQQKQCKEANADICKSIENSRKINWKQYTKHPEM